MDLFISHGLLFNTPIIAEQEFGKPDIPFLGYIKSSIKRHLHDIVIHDFRYSVVPNYSDGIRRQVWGQFANPPLQDPNLPVS